MNHNLSRGASGFSLIQSVASMAALAALGLVAYSLIQSSAKTTSQAAIANTARQIRQQLISYLNDDSAWSQDVSKVATLDCLQNKTDCSGKKANATNPIAVYRADGTLFYDPKGSSDGFTTQGTNCKFNPAGDDLCPLKVDLSWTPVCDSGNCTSPQVKITGTFSYMPKTLGQNFNSGNYSFVVIRGSTKASAESICIALGGTYDTSGASPKCIPFCSTGLTTVEGGITKCLFLPGAQNPPQSGGGGGTGGGASNVSTLGCGSGQAPLTTANGTTCTAVLTGGLPPGITGSSSTLTSTATASLTLSSTDTSTSSATISATSTATASSIQTNTTTVIASSNTQTSTSSLSCTTNRYAPNFTVSALAVIVPQPGNACYTGAKNSCRDPNIMYEASSSCCGGYACNVKISISTTQAGAQQICLSADKLQSDYHWQGTSNPFSSCVPFPLVAGGALPKIQYQFGRDNVIYTIDSDLNILADCKGRPTPKDKLCPQGGTIVNGMCEVCQ